MLIKRVFAKNGGTVTITVLVINSNTSVTVRVRARQWWFMNRTFISFLWLPALSHHIGDWVHGWPENDTVVNDSMTYEAAQYWNQHSLKKSHFKLLSSGTDLFLFYFTNTWYIYNLHENWMHYQYVINCAIYSENTCGLLLFSYQSL